MRPLLISLCLLLALPPCLAQVADTAKQLLVVTTPGWTDVAGTAQRYERRGAEFRKIGAAFPIVVGRSGMGWDPRLPMTDAVATPVKHEGDGRSPAGIFPLGAAFGYESSAHTHLAYLPLTATVECVDDVHSTQYNQVIDGQAFPRDWNSSEHMRRDDELYHHGIIVAYNQPAVAGAGSCIFLHIWKNADSGTDGCTAMEPEKMAMLMSWFDPKKNPQLVQLPQAQYERMRTAWSLPAP